MVDLSDARIVKWKEHLWWLRQNSGSCATLLSRNALTGLYQWHERTLGGGTAPSTSALAMFHQLITIRGNKAS
jgi:hypothetical protein